MTMIPAGRDAEVFHLTFTFQGVDLAFAGARWWGTIMARPIHVQRYDLQEV